MNITMFFAQLTTLTEPFEAKIQPVFRVAVAFVFLLNTILLS